MSRAVHLRLHTLALPVVLVAALQVSGCTREAIEPPPPGGTYLSESAGASFDQSVQVEGQEGEYIARFSLHGADRPAFVADTMYIAAGDKGVVLSKNNGRTWHVIGTPLTNTLDVVLLENRTLVISGTDGEGQGFILRSLDEGKSWQSVLTIPLPNKKAQFGFFSTGGQASVLLSLSSDPFNRNRLYAGSNLGTIFVGEQSAKVWRTIHTLKAGQYDPLQAAENFGIRKLVPSIHQAGQLLVITTDRRLIRITDGKQEVIPVPENIGEATLFGSVGNRDIYDALFIPGFPQALLVGIENGVVATRDGGQTWLDLNIPIDRAQKFSTIQVAVSPSNTNRILVAIGNVIYRSEDGGTSWNTFSLGVQDIDITNISIDPFNAAHVLLTTVPAGS